MNLWDLYAKFEKARTWLATSGADTLDGFIEGNEKVLDVARQVRDYLRTLDDGVLTASLSVEDTNAVERFKELKAEIETLTKPTQVVGVRALPPGFRDLLLFALSQLIEKLLEKWG